LLFGTVHPFIDQTFCVSRNKFHMAIIPINLKSGTVVQEESPVVGIDLGTSNSLVALMRDGRPIALRDDFDKSVLMPSVLHFAKDGKLLVGNEAKSMLGFAPERTVFSVKRLLGKSYTDLHEVAGRLGYRVIAGETEESLVRVEVDGRFYSPIELSAEILKALKRRVEKELGQTVSKTVITVPAYFNDTQRQATRDAGKLAGWDVLRIINEPTAASLAYGLDQMREERQVIAVYDFGGGTFDLSILALEDGIFDVLSTHGDTFLGGDDIDQAIINYWVAQGGLSLHNQPMLRVWAEEAKKSLSTLPLFEKKLGNVLLTLDQIMLHQLMAPFVERTLACCSAALKDAKLTKSEINHVVLVGGSTRAPYVQMRVQEFFEKDRLFNDLNPDEVVALGAAVQADILSGKRSDWLLLDITPLSLGIETVGGLMDVILPRNAKVPTRVARSYTTSVDNQTALKVAVYQGERDMVADNRKLGEFNLRGIPPMPAGIPKIEIRFMLDADGILTVQAAELRSGVQQQVEIRAAYGISEEDMARMLLDSIQYADSDRQSRALIEAQTEGKHIVHSAQKFISQNSDWLSDEDVRRIDDLTSVLVKAIHGQDKDTIMRCIETLNTFTTPLAHQALDRNIGRALQGQALEES
jgi:molecular chaperone HscA